MDGRHAAARGPVDGLDDDAESVDLARYAQVLLRRRWIVASAAVISILSAAIYVSTARPVYESTALVLIEKERQRQFHEEGVLVDASADDYYQTQYRLLRSRSLLKGVYDELALDKTEDFAGGAGSLADRVSVAPVARSRLLNVSVESHDPELAARVANAVCERFVRENIENRLFISKEILRLLYPAGDGGGAGRAPDIETDSLPAVVNSALIQKLKANYADLEIRWGDLSRRYTPEHPERVRLKSQIEALAKLIREETAKVVKGIRAELSGQLQGNNIRIIDRAEPPGSPSRPRKGRTLLLAALLGLLGGSLLALGVDALDQTIHTQEDVERGLRLGFLGSVPMAEVKGDTAASYANLLSGPRSFTGEALKNIRTMIGFAAAGTEMRTLLITSTGQGEGKTFIGMSLAMVFAQLGERILLIEGDLRRPSLHRRFSVSRERGLSHYLAHGQAPGDVEDLIQATEVPNLHVLTCGQIPPNPAELLSTPRLRGLMAWARERYDRVLVDGTPIFPITDALLWANHVDAVLFVVKFGATHAALAGRAVQKLREGGLRVAGAVVNQVTARAGSYGDYYYYYYYHSDYVDARPKQPV